jgi:hypothetical protein
MLSPRNQTIGLVVVFMCFFGALICFSFESYERLEYVRAMQTRIDSLEAQLARIDSLEAQLAAARNLIGQKK